MIGIHRTGDSCRPCLAYLLAGAALTAVTLVLPQLGLFEWFTLIPLMIGAYKLCENEACTLKKAYGYGFLTIYVFYFVIYHWFVYLYPLDFVGMDNAASAAVIVVGWFGLPLLQAVWGGFVFLLFRLLHKIKLFVRIPLLRPFVFAALWVVFEWISTLHWTGVPWGRLYMGQAELLPILQSASLLGAYLISWLLIAVNGLLAYAVLYQLRATLCGTIAGVLFFSNLMYGGLRMLIDDPVSERTVTVGVIQGNIDSHEKWSSESYRITTERYGELTRRAAADGAELIVWPESTLPFSLNQRAYAYWFVSDLARECNVTLLIGALYEDEEGNEYNALYLVEPDGTVREDIYAKQHLVPFGEYVPMRDVITTLIPPLANLSALGADIVAGDDSALFDTEWGKVGSMICFDSIYEQLTIDSVRDGANLLVISSNDNWFLDSAAVYQHQAQAQIRAIESGRYIARAGSTGISSIITPYGESLEYIEPLVDGYAVHEVELLEHSTPYMIVGNLFVYLCILFTVLSFVYGAFFEKLSLKK